MKFRAQVSAEFFLFSLIFCVELQPTRRDVCGLQAQRVCAAVQRHQERAQQVREFDPGKLAEGGRGQGETEDLRQRDGNLTDEHRSEREVCLDQTS